MVFYGWILKNLDSYSGQGWYSTLEGVDSLLETKNIRASQSPLLGDRVPYLGYGMYEEFKTVYAYICNELFLVDEDGFGTRKMTSLCKLFGGYQDFEEKFQQLRAHSYTTYAEFKGR